jgi:hypothetical protein
MTTKGGKDHYLDSKISVWQKRADEHREKQMSNPFSEWNDDPTKICRIDKNDPNYGRPLPGSLTEKRGQLADKHINAEIAELCHIIVELGTLEADGTTTIRFGRLFDAYTRVSTNLVGMLVRARKRGLVQFEGEMLYQRRDDDVIITCSGVPE